MLSPEQMAFRAAREARDGEVVFVGRGLAAKVRRYLSPGVRIVTDDAPDTPGVDVAFLSAKKVCCRGDLIASARSGSKTRCDWPSVPDCRAGRTVVLIPHTANGKANIVEHATEGDAGGENGFKHRRIITDLALIDITDTGLVLREVAPGVDARDVQSLTGTLLLVGPDLAEMELSEPLR
jgi:acyl CoA:acetate/3-ketoacid CoA transferase beta subunit